MINDSIPTMHESENTFCNKWTKNSLYRQNTDTKSLNAITTKRHQFYDNGEKNEKAGRKTFLGFNLIPKNKSILKLDNL